MKTTMDELFMELNKDNTPIGASIPGADLSQLEKMMDKKLTDLMDKIDKDKTPPKAAEGGTEPPKATEGSTEPPKATEGGTEPPKAAEGGTEPPKATEGGTEPPKATE